MTTDFQNIHHFASVEEIPVLKAAAIFTTDTSRVFREERDLSPVPVSDSLNYMPWGADNQMPYNILDLIEADETLSTCQLFNAEVCYGAGLQYATGAPVAAGAPGVCGTPAAGAEQEVADFVADNCLPSYWLGVCQDFKHFNFAVSVIILDRSQRKIIRVERKEACYCRFQEADANGEIKNVLYANWRDTIPTAEEIEVIPLLSRSAQLSHLRSIIQSGSKQCKFAIVSRVPTPDSTYYPIPHYGSLFRSKWYNIKQLIAIAKEAKLKNSAPIKYHIQIAERYWMRIFKAEGITDPAQQKLRVIKEKQNIINFLAGAENSGKALFSQVYVSPDGHTQQDVTITKVDSGKEGGDYETDIQEAINMICFTMRVHSNLVGSVPGKSQSNNSGSDKRELYTIAQALQKPYRDILFNVHRLIIAFNGWRGYQPTCPFVQLTTLDEHRDARQVTN